ncbi:hypothetical protein CB1_056579001 [Camelus ferus]|nr:hypothetical protein CB1_056579001 [Camelus ferus]
MSMPTLLHPAAVLTFALGLMIYDIFLVDNFLDLEDLDVDEEIKPQMSQVTFHHLEDEQHVRAVTIFIFISGQSLLATSCPDNTEYLKIHIIGDEVQPFSLDEEFDYDAVVLTPKFTPAEIDAVKELSKQKRKSTL